MNVDIEKVKEILLRIESEDIYEIHYILDMLSNYGIEESISINQPNEISHTPEDVFIRCLANNTSGIHEMGNFTELLDKLSDANSLLINYLIVRNNHASSKTLAKIATSSNTNDSILSEIVQHTDEFSILEAIFNKANVKIRIDILNKKSFKNNSKSHDYYLNCFINFDIGEIDQLNPNCIPLELTDEFNKYKRIHYLESCITELEQSYDSCLEADNPTLLETLKTDLKNAQDELDSLTNNNLQI